MQIDAMPYSIPRDPILETLNEKLGMNLNPPGTHSEPLNIFVSSSVGGFRENVKMVTQVLPSRGKLCLQPTSKAKREFRMTFDNGVRTYHYNGANSVAVFLKPTMLRNHNLVDILKYFKRKANNAEMKYELGPELIVEVNKPAFFDVLKKDRSNASNLNMTVYNNVYVFVLVEGVAVNGMFLQLGRFYIKDVNKSTVTFSPLNDLSNKYNSHEQDASDYSVEAYDHILTTLIPFINERERRDAERERVVQREREAVQRSRENEKERRDAERERRDAERERRDEERERVVQREREAVQRSREGEAVERKRQREGHPTYYSLKKTTDPLNHQGYKIPKRPSHDYSRNPPPYNNHPPPSWLNQYGTMFDDPLKIMKMSVTKAKIYDRIRNTYPKDEAEKIIKKVDAFNYSEIAAFDKNFKSSVQNILDEILVEEIGNEQDTLDFIVGA